MLKEKKVKRRIIAIFMATLLMIGVPLEGVRAEEINRKDSSSEGCLQEEISTEESETVELEPEEVEPKKEKETFDQKEPFEESGTTAFEQEEEKTLPTEQQTDDAETEKVQSEESCFGEIIESLDQYAASKKNNPEIANGVYQITTALKTNMTVEIAGGGIENGVKVQIYSSNETAAQRWKVENLDDGYVRIVSVKSGKVLDVKNGMAKQSVKVQQYTWNGTRAQKWLPVKNENGTYTFYSALGNHLVLDVAGASKNNGTSLQVYSANKTSAQMFKMYPANAVVKAQEKVLENGWYYISSKAASNAIMDLRNGNCSNEARIQVFSQNGTLSQGMYVEYCSDGYYRIRVGKTGKSIDLRSGGLIPGTEIQQWDNDKNTKNQKWVIEKNEDGTYRIVSVTNGLSISVGNGRVGTTLTVQEKNDTVSQKWTFKKFEPTIADGCYIVSSSINNKKTIDVSNASKSAGAKIQIYDSNYTMAQKWQIRNKSNGSVTLQNVGSGLYLTVSGNKLTQLSNGDNVPEAQWKLGVQMGSGLTLKNLKTGKLLDLSGANSSNGTLIGTYSANGTKAQAWNFVGANVLENGFYEFAPMTNQSLRLDVSCGSRNNGANVQVYQGNGTLSQRWWVRSAGNGWYTLTACCSAQLLDVKNSSTASGANVQQWPKNGNDAQLWKFKMGSRGVMLVSAKGTVLDVCGGSGSSGANVQTWKNNETNAQQWSVHPAGQPSKIGWQNPAGYPQVSSRTVKLPGYCNGYFTYVSPSRIALDASRKECIDAFIGRAYEYLGTKYIEPWSSWPGDAVDCSGLVLQCLYATGMDMGVYNPYNHRWQAWQTYNSMNWYRNRTFMPVSVSDIQRGDVVYYNGHIAIYIGNGQIIDSWPGQGVSIRGLYSRGRVIGAARPFV